MKEEVKVFDALKARKVLERVHNYLGILIRENLVKDAPFLKDGELENESDLADDVWEVLQGVPRNCDVGTDEEQSRRYEELCDSHTCGSMCSLTGCPMYEYDCSPFAWGQMPYEEAKGGKKCTSHN